MKYETAQCSLLGNRKSNQDRSLILEAPDAVLLALADGMGGHPKGEMAAQILMDNCRKAFLTSRKPISSPRIFLSGIMEMSHRQIIEYGHRQTPPIEPRTTGVLCLVQDNNAYWAHIGDSRLYLMHDGVIRMRTDDHSYVEHLRQQGLISNAQVHTHKFRNYVTRCLGGINNRPVADLQGPQPLQDGDIILLCSDGFWGSLPERPLVDALYKRQRPLGPVIGELARKAEQIGSPESDNVTSVALRWRHGNIDLEPADISMALPDNPAAANKTEKGESDIDKAIETLRKIIDLNEFEE